MDKNTATEWVKNAEGKFFTACENGETEGLIGKITMYNHTYDVFYQRDRVGHYITLQQTTDNLPNVNCVESRVKSEVIDGKCERNENKLTLKSTFPILDEDFFQKQLKQSIIEVYHMLALVEDRLKVLEKMNVAQMQELKCLEIL